MDDIELPTGIEIDDPRPIAAKARYTFFLPHPEELAALKPGDEIKAIFRQIEGGRHYDAERMWVLIERIDGGTIVGTLDNNPYDMPLLKSGDRVRIPISHVISTEFFDGHERPKVSPRREYWDRCFVDGCILEGRSHVDYL
jgi:uncharacterized protein YegJ (DUF2314 family)